MNREEFLSHEEVIDFIEWLKDELTKIEFKLNFTSSRYVPGGLECDVTGISNVLEKYVWCSAWTDQKGLRINSKDWYSTHESLVTLSAWLNDVVENGQIDDVRKACFEVLKWGGVRGALPFLSNTQDLAQYLINCKQIFKLNQADLSNIAVRRYDAGMTKIHALLDANGLPIYDSRVGAAISMLHAIFLNKKNIKRPFLSFPTGAARGQQIRNPGSFGYTTARNFSGINPNEWAKYAVILGWIMEEVLNRNKEMFAGQSSRMHAFEAALFMVGYDLRCFLHYYDTNAKNMSCKAKRSGPNEHINSPLNKEDNLGDNERPRNYGWVPAGHSFQKVCNLYLEYRNDLPKQVSTSFTEWQNIERNINRNTAQANNFPIRDFDFTNRHLENLKLISKGGEIGLCAVMYPNMRDDHDNPPELESFEVPDERENVCLVDVLLTGWAYQYHTNRFERSNYLCNTLKVAGTTQAADTLLSVGRSVGKHFGLLDQECKPTELFTRIFGQYNINDDNLIFGG
jgi:hypothetical protein